MIKSKTLKKLCLGVGLAAVALSASATTSLAETELVLSSWLPPKHPIVTQVMKPWAKQVKEATGGSVTVRVLSKPLGPPPAHYDMAVDGVADITYGLHSFTRDDRFQRSRIGQFSFLGDTATDASVAFWNVYGGQLEAQKEHKGVELLGLFLHGPGLYQNAKRKINDPADFSGLKIRTPGGYIAELVNNLGSTTQFMGPSEVYEKLSRGVIDGVTFPIETLKSFKLNKQIKYALSVPGGLYNTSWFLVMNEGKWNALSAEEQKAIEGVSGEAFAKLAGAAWDKADAAGTKLAKKTGVEVYGPSPAVMGRIKELAADAEAAWAEKLAADGYDGAAALKAFRDMTNVQY
ncbi:TRAP transporter substrate-binding protein [Rhodovibrionaceae bacterium A322]